MLGKSLNFFDKNLHYYYLFFIILYSVLYIFITPPFATPDEHNHFRKAASDEKIYLNGKLSIDKNIQKFSEQIKNKLFTNKKINLNQYLNSNNDNYFSDNFENADLANLTGYPYYAYFIPKFGFSFSKLFTNNILKSFYAGRLFNLFLFISCSYLLIKLNICRDFFYILLFLPTTLSLVNSYSADSFIISIICLYAYFFLKDKKELTLKNILICNCVILLISVIKPVYIFLNLIVLLYSRKYLKINIIANILILALLLFYFYDYPLMPIDNNLTTKTYIVNYLLLNPVGTIKLFFLTVLLESKVYAYEIIGVVGHMVNISLYFICYYLLAIYLFYIIYKNMEFSKKSILTVSIILLSALVILATIYLNTNTPGQYEVIKNVRGRYFLILLFFLSCTFNTSIKNNFKNKNLITIVFFLSIFFILNFYEQISIKFNIVISLFICLLVYQKYFRIFFKLMIPHFNILILYNIYNFYY